MLVGVQRESGLTHSDHRLLMGALSFKHKSVRSVMTPIRDCFMLANSLRLNFQTMLAIYKSGFTRIPVFEGKRRKRMVIAMFFGGLSRNYAYFRLMVHHGAARALLMPCFVIFVPQVPNTILSAFYTAKI